MNMWKSTKVCTAFLFMGHTFWKENTEDRVKYYYWNQMCYIAILR